MLILDLCGFYRSEGANCRFGSEDQWFSCRIQTSGHHLTILVWMVKAGSLGDLLLDSKAEVYVSDSTLKSSLVPGRDHHFAGELT